MKKLLIISRFFAPAPTIGAIRWSKLCKYLPKDEFEIDILCGYPNGEPDPILHRELKEMGSIIRVGDPPEGYTDDYTAYAGIPKPTGTPAPYRPATGIKKLILNSPLFKLYQNTRSVIKQNNETKAFTKRALKTLFSERRVEGYDCIISSYGPVCNVLIALELKKLYPNIPLIVDFRDPMTSSTAHYLQRRRLKQLQTEVCEKADRILAASDGYLQKVCPTYALRNKGHIFYNGFDHTDFDAQENTETALPDSFDGTKFSFCYTGDIYVGKRDFSALFECLSRLFTSGQLSRDDVRIYYAGFSFPRFYEQSHKFGMDDCVVDLGLLSREQALLLQRSVRILLLTSWNYPDELGVMPGKVYEYMRAGRPILCMMSGSQPDSELKQLIGRAHVGITHELSRRDKDDYILSSFLLNQYALYKKGEPPEYQPIKSIVDGFDYCNLAKRAEEIIRSVIK